MTNEQKAKIMEDEARKIDRYGCSLVPPDGFAALLRECAAMLRERDGVRWCQTSYVDGRWIGIYRQFAIEIVMRPASFLWDVWEAETGKPRTFNNHSNTLDAAKAAAVKWVDGQEGK